jgi:hypothetical protein
MRNNNKDINYWLARNPVNSKYGAPSGAKPLIEPKCPSDDLLCQRVDIDSGGYSRDGTYWGQGKKLFAILNNDNYEYGFAEGIRLFIRADTRAEALDKALMKYSKLAFKHSC